MYESEVNIKTEDKNQLSKEILNMFNESKNLITAKTIIPWGEHCTECTWPECYQTCDLFIPRIDGSCRRFIDGMVIIPCGESTNSYLLKIRFKKWGKLWAYGNVRLFPLRKALIIEKYNKKIGQFIYNFPIPIKLKKFLMHKFYLLKKRLARKATRKSDPTHFLIECYNPNLMKINLSLTIRPVGEESKMPFLQLSELSSGFNRIKVPVDDISEIVNLSNEFEVDLIPNDIEDGTELIFGVIDFIKDKSSLQKKKLCKCVIWDLDNTLWDGILVEDGENNIKLKPGVDSVIKELDRRGILNSIASKNNEGEALKALERFKLKEYFVASQISWCPKGESIKNIAKILNIGIDTFIFVDDSRFEREQVKSVLPQIKVVDGRDYKSILDLEECQVPITTASSKRRLMYISEAKRQEILSGFDGDYFEFLSNCKIKLTIKPLGEENIERVHDLTQRTNQMNFSGNRYTKEVLQEIMNNENMATYVMNCKDRYGNYGIIGFCVVDVRIPVISDLMFSCRVQSKRVEHAFLTFFINKLVKEYNKDIQALYRKTERNTQSGKVFDDFMFEMIEEKDGISCLLFEKNKEILNDNLISIHEITD